MNKKQNAASNGLTSQSSPYRNWLVLGSTLQRAIRYRIQSYNYR